MQFYLPLKYLGLIMQHCKAHTQHIIHCKSHMHRVGRLHQPKKEQHIIHFHDFFYDIFIMHKYYQTKPTNSSILQQPKKQQQFWQHTLHYWFKFNGNYKQLSLEKNYTNLATSPRLASTIHNWLVLNWFLVSHNFKNRWKLNEHKPSKFLILGKELGRLTKTRPQSF